jgi:hypothetical protein
VGEPNLSRTEVLQWQPERLSGGVPQTIRSSNLTHWPTFLISKQHAQYFPASFPWLYDLLGPL